jgi:hypothetical protein
VLEDALLTLSRNLKTFVSLSCISAYKCTFAWSKEHVFKNVAFSVCAEAEAVFISWRKMRKVCALNASEICKYFKNLNKLFCGSSMSEKQYLHVFSAVNALCTFVSVPLPIMGHSLGIEGNSLSVVPLFILFVVGYSLSTNGKGLQDKGRMEKAQRQTL